MIRRIIKILALLVVVIVLAVPAAALFVDDETVSSVLEGIPYVGDYTEDIVGGKQDLQAALDGYIADTVHGFQSIFFDVLGFSAPRQMAKVVIDLPPARPSPAQALPPSPPAGEASPMVQRPVANQGESASEPATPAAAMPAAAMPAPPPAAPTAKPTAKPAPAAGSTAAKKAGGKDAKQVARAGKDTGPKAAGKAPSKKDPEADQDHKRGLLFYKGVGVAKDFKKAAQWFRRAAKKGHAGAQYNLGIMSYLGQGVDQDYAKAAQWFQKAGEQDHAAAQYNLGFLYYEGKGVAKDDLQAFMWIDRSASLGDEKAVRARETLQKALPKDIFKQ